MKKKPIHLKEIGLQEKSFFHFKIDPTTYVLYDGDMGEPVAYGSFNLVSATITKLPTSSTIYYFESDKAHGWKMKKAYKPEGKTATDEDKKKRETADENKD
jgi:hypothetical protein